MLSLLLASGARRRAAPTVDAAYIWKPCPSWYRGETIALSSHYILFWLEKVQSSWTKSKIFHSPFTWSKMADSSDTTPFLADNDHGDNCEESHVTKRSPANAHFKLPIKILSIIISVLSFLICGILIGSYIFINTGPFQYTYGSSESVRDLAICICSVFPSLTYTTPSNPNFLNIAC
jgi:hypothetical protein